MGGNPGLRPLAFGEILDVALKIFGRHWRTLVACVLVPTVPIQIISVLVVLSIAPDQFDLSRDTSTSADTGGAEIAGVLVVRLLEVLASILAWAACFKAVADGYLGREASVGTSLRFGLPKIPRLFGLSIVAGVLIVIGLILIIIPGLVLMTFLSLAVPALLFERIGVFGSIGRSFELVSGRFWSILLLMIVTILALLVVSFVFGLLLGGIGVAVSEDSEAVGAAVTFVAAVIATAITTPIFAAIISVLYFDQRVRKEGFDLQLLAEGVGEQGSYPTAPQAPPEAPVQDAGLSGWQPPGPPPPGPRGGS